MKNKLPTSARSTALATLVGAGSLALAMTWAMPAHGHGWIIDLPSRAELCSNGTLSDCGPIQYEPQSVEGPQGFPEAGAVDGQICAGENGAFAPLDNPRSGEWPAVSISAGEQDFIWEFTAPHSTHKFSYWITHEDYSPLDPLSRSDLDLSEPLYEEYLNGQQPNWTETHTVPLPERSGRHLILAYWEIADTDNAFYGCIDVVFDGDGGDNGGDDGDNGDDDNGGGDDGDNGQCSGIPVWSTGTVYWGGDQVQHNGQQFRAKWWTLNQEPGTTGEWGVWETLGDC